MLAFFIFGYSLSIYLGICAITVLNGHSTPHERLWHIFCKGKWAPYARTYKECDKCGLKIKR